ncbi:vacuolar protein sorting-associated protein 26 [Drosophila guanche]|uniref:Vacuolar protein sorting-associated protein 26 n=1 Tax=Drosophila guanche TaxID=7266 RepID=A0A3B0JA31_DROGU|nr:vacuolar protein sorting-associated protein 26 [Drosophila guanche]SPP78815.1 blast:Vacuolar protein sorting-associated protein 26 [Drosophila guanche]
MNFLGFGQSAEIEIVFDGAEHKTAEVKGEDGKVEKMLLFYDGETVSGKVNVTLKKPGSKLEHQGIKIEFIGQIELFYDRGTHHEFKCLAKALARPGDLIQNNSYPFDFPNVEKQFEVYAGSNVRLRYFLRATIVRRISDITREVDIAVHTLCSYPEMNNPIKMEVGIEDCLHIEFEYNKSKYHLRDTIIGKIYFLLVRIKIKHMEIAIIKRESTGTGPNMFNESETIAKYEIMDGAPVKGESIPIRVFLAGYNLTPTMRDINKKFSVKYFLNLVLMDTEDRRYFKQQEITLWRKADIPRYHVAQHQQQQHQQHQHVPLHAPPHLVSGPAAPTVAPSLINASTATDSSEGAATAGSAIGAGVGVGDGVASTESKMGLFTRESPNQEFSQQQLDSPLPNSPPLTPPNESPVEREIRVVEPTSTPTPTPAAAAAESDPISVAPERGMGDGAAAATASASPIAMLSSSPPPLPVQLTATQDAVPELDLDVATDQNVGATSPAAAAKKVSATPLAAD